MGDLRFQFNSHLIDVLHVEIMFYFIAMNGLLLQKNNNLIFKQYRTKFLVFQVYFCLILQRLINKWLRYEPTNTSNQGNDAEHISGLIKQIVTQIW